MKPRRSFVRLCDWAVLPPSLPLDVEAVRQSTARLMSEHEARIAQVDAERVRVREVALSTGVELGVAEVRELRRLASVFRYGGPNG